MYILLKKTKTFCCKAVDYSQCSVTGGNKNHKITPVLLLVTKLWATSDTSTNFTGDIFP